LYHAAGVYNPLIVKPDVVTASLAYGGSPASLAILWLEVLELAHAGDDAGVARRLAALELQSDHLDELFGGGAAARLGPEYRRAFAVFSGEGSIDIASKIRERRYDDVEVLAAGGVCPESISPQVGQSENLRTNTAVYTVRLKRSEETEGIRIDTFVFLDGRWRTALKVGLRNE
jgi:hypothetical protein